VEMGAPGGWILDIGTLRGAITALTMLVYGGIFWWAYRGGNRSRFEQDALLPFDDDELPRERGPGGKGEER